MLLILLGLLIVTAVPWISIICIKIAGFNPGEKMYHKNIKKAIWFDVILFIVIGCILLLKKASSWI